MSAWIVVACVFMGGFVLGGTLSSLWFRARLDLYRRFVEDRLNSINLPRPSSAP